MININYIFHTEAVSHPITKSQFWLSDRHVPLMKHNSATKFLFNKSVICPQTSLLS
jgi:hypothetical protein